MAEQKRKGLSRLNKAILFLITSAFFFALMNMFVRLSGDVPTIQKTFFRNFFALFIASGAMIKNRCSIILPKGARFDLFMRAACGYAGVVLNFYAIDRLSISDASLLNKMSPFFAIIFSTFLLKERANKVQWAIILTARFSLSSRPSRMRSWEPPSRDSAGECVRARRILSSAGQRGRASRVTMWCSFSRRFQRLWRSR